MKKDQLVTKNYFEKTLDKRLSQQAQVIIAAVDGVLTKRFAAFGQQIEKRVEKLEERLGIEIRAI